MGAFVGKRGGIDWEQLYLSPSATGSKPRRISLPTYPFAREHYWMSGGQEIDTLAEPQEGLKTESIKVPDVDEAIQEMDSLLFKLLRGYIQSLGGLSQSTQTFSALKEQIKLQDRYERWLHETLFFLQRNKDLQFDGKTIATINNEPVNLESIWKEWKQKRTDWLAQSHALHDASKNQSVVIARSSLIELVMQSLPDILTGQQLATEIMFPASSMQRVEGVYKNNPVSDYYNNVLAEAVVAFIKEHPERSGEIRILEIGAGTGGTSAMVFKKLQENNLQAQVKEYCYTDLSQAFLMHANKEYTSTNPYLNAKIFNVERSLEAQGMHPGQYDLTIATNVLHATKNIIKSVNNTRATLRKGGFSS